MARMYGETTLPGSLLALFHDIFFNLSISTDKLETRGYNPDFRDYIFHFSVVGTPVYTENQTKWRR